MQRLIRQPLLILVLSVLGAVIAAFIEALNRASANHWSWDWIKLSQDVARNAFIAVLITWLTKKVQSYQDVIQTSLGHARVVFTKNGLDRRDSHRMGLCAFLRGPLMCLTKGM